MLQTWVIVENGRGRNASIFPTALDDWDFTHEEYFQFLAWKQPKDEARREAVQLLRAAGFSTANPLKFVVTTGGPDPAAHVLLAQEHWFGGSGGIVERPELKLVDTPTGNRARNSRDYVVWQGVGLSAGVVEPDAYVTGSLRSNGDKNFTNYSDATLDAMIDRQRATLNVQERKVLIKEILRYAADKAPLVIPAARYGLKAVSSKVQNFGPEGTHPYGRNHYEVWLDA
jgi:ABC-type transport system substrate-binding protein